MITTHGLTHLALSVRDPERSLRFYAAVAAVKSAGGTIGSKGEFGPGLPYAFVRDPDGYEIEIWFE